LACVLLAHLETSLPKLSDNAESALWEMK